VTLNLAVFPTEIGGITLGL